MRTAAAIAMLALTGCYGATLSGPPAQVVHPEAVQSAIDAYAQSEGEVTDRCARIARTVMVIVLPRARVEELCRVSFMPGMGACIGLFANGWRAYVAEDNVNIAGSVDHELRHFLPRCHGHPTREDVYHCGGWWPEGTECTAPSKRAREP